MHPGAAAHRPEAAVAAAAAGAEATAARASDSKKWSSAFFSALISSTRERARVRCAGGERATRASEGDDLRATSWSLSTKCENYREWGFRLKNTRRREKGKYKRSL